MPPCKPRPDASVCQKCISNIESKTPSKLAVGGGREGLDRSSGGGGTGGIGAPTCQDASSVHGRAPVLLGSAVLHARRLGQGHGELAARADALRNNHGHHLARVRRADHELHARAVAGGHEHRKGAGRHGHLDRPLRDRWRRRLVLLLGLLVGRRSRWWGHTSGRSSSNHSTVLVVDVDLQRARWGRLLDSRASSRGPESNFEGNPRQPHNSVRV